MIQRINDPDLPVTKDSVLVLKNSGPVGGRECLNGDIFRRLQKLLDQDT
jgi:dihydroxy-acid dehydratase